MDRLIIPDAVQVIASTAWPRGQAPTSGCCRCCALAPRLVWVQMARSDACPDRVGGTSGSCQGYRGAKTFSLSATNGHVSGGKMQRHEHGGLITCPVHGPQHPKGHAS